MDFENLLRNNLIINFTQVGNVWVVEFDKQFVENYKKHNPTSTNIKSNVVYAAAITSKARIKLYEAFEKILANGGRLLYCDTDCIFYSGEKLHIGDGRPFQKKIIDAIFISPKLYALMCDDNVVEVKGWQQNATIDFNNLKCEFYGGVNGKHKNPIFNELHYLNQIGVDESFFSKRKFTRDKKSTTPLIYLNGVYI